MKVKSVAFIKSVANIKEAPKQPLPAIAFAGRSNVGKSTLINTILNKKNIAKISSKPGKTRLLNYFKINDKIHLVDLPGYGFAKVGKKMQDDWKQLIESFLTGNAHLKLVLVIVDIRRGLKEMDLQLFEWLEDNNINTQLIFSKCDKVSKNEAMKTLHSTKKEFALSYDPIMFSSVKKTGINEVWTRINAETVH